MANKVKSNTPAMWIRRHMLDSPVSNLIKNEKRTLTEAELKVQRSLQKLSIPEWYLNNNSRPPKILTNDTPIQSRPPAWKEQSRPKTVVSSSFEKTPKYSTMNRNGVLETDFGLSPSSPPKSKSNPRSSSSTNSTSTQKTPEKILSGSRVLNRSRSYPRISPCRKIQNINLVFPKPFDGVLSQTVAVMDHPDYSEVSATQDSFEAINNSEMNEEEISMSAVCDVSIVSTSSEIKERISRMPTRQFTYIKPWKSPMSQDKKIKLTSAPTPINSPNTSLVLYSSTLKQKKSPSQSISSSRSFGPPKEKPPPPPITPQKVKKIDPDDDYICDACFNDSGKFSSHSLRNRSRNNFQSSLCSIDEKRTITSKSFQPASSTIINNSTPKNKSIVTLKEENQFEDETMEDELAGDESLVHEIIKELNEKCENSIHSTYVTPGSKKFVKKLVKALEKVKNSRDNVMKKNDIHLKRIVGYSDEDEIPSSEDDSKTSAVPTYISYKDTDSSDSGNRSPSTTRNYHFDWNMNLQKNQNNKLHRVIKDTRKNDDSVYWIPITQSKLPRTSSLLSMMSRLSSSNPGSGQYTPSVSPIKRSNQKKNTLSWGMTCRPGDYTRSLRRIDETIILDSGYDDKPREHSSPESSDDNWFDDHNSNSSNRFSNTFPGISRERRSKPLNFGRPRVQI